MYPIDVPYKEICKLPGLEAFKDYLVDIKGNVYSTKHNRIRILKPTWCHNKENPFHKVKLYDGNGNKKWFFIHHLVAASFMLTEHRGKYLIHKNNNHQDNSLQNLYWTNDKPGGKKRKSGEKRELRVKEYELNDKIRKEIDLVHRAALEKGLHMSESFSFINEVVEDMLEEYCSKRGLKKILYRMRNESNGT